MSTTIPFEIHLQRDSNFRLDVKFCIPKCGLTVLFGPSGCGKTTLLRAIAGLEKQAKGYIGLGNEIWLNSELNLFVPTYQRHIGYVFQEPSLFEHLNVYENLCFGLKRSRPKDGAERLQHAIHLLGIEDLLTRSIDELSGGEKQRCAIARALCLRPKILLMDEPLSALDQARKNEIIPWLIKVKEELSIPILYVTHSLDELLKLGDYVITLHQGSLQAQGTLSELIAHNQLPFAKGSDEYAILEGTVQHIDPQWHHAHIAMQGWVITAPGEALHVGQKVRLQVYAQDVALSKAPLEDCSIQNQLFVRIDRIDDLASTQSTLLLTLKHPQTERVLLARVLKKSAHALQLQVGQTLYAHIKGARLLKT